MKIIVKNVTPVIYTVKKRTLILDVIQPLQAQAKNITSLDTKFRSYVIVYLLAYYNMYFMKSCTISLAPSIVIYDNACNLRQYVLNREPEFFKHTKFLVDRFHWGNHKGIILKLLHILLYNWYFQLVAMDTNWMGIPNLIPSTARTGQFPFKTNKAKTNKNYSI